MGSCFISLRSSP